MKPLNPRLIDWRGQRVWLIGASSGIGAALARELARRGARLALSARSAGKLQALVAELPSEARVLPLDLRDADAVQDAARDLLDRWQGWDLVVILAGAYSPMRADQLDLAVARQMVETNLMGVYHALAATLPTLLAQKQGGVAIVSSVAGYVGLPQSLVYGPTKAALINLAESLYGDLHPQGLGVYLIDPGFVDTPLTRGNEFHMPALMTPEAAALAILEGLGRGQFEIHFPRRFTLWLKLLRLLPYRWQLAAVRRFTGL